MIKDLYIHIPFCDHICTYCDFYKMIAKKEVIVKYINYLEKELELKKDYLENIENIYIGGGTPSSIGIDNLNNLFITLSKYIDLNKIKEFSMEFNPTDVNEDIINLSIKYHVNRISLGVQSLNSDKLALMGRNHNKNDVIKAIKTLQKKFIFNINVDLIYAFPKDDFRGIKKDIKTLIKEDIKHFSCYSLILEEKTILYHKYLRNEFTPFDSDKEAKLYYNIQKYLHKKKYYQYEISNFAKEGFECQYNLNTWNNCKYLGIGASANYYIDNKRYDNFHNLNKYFDALDNNKQYFNVIEINKNEQMYEEIMLGLRKTNGINIETFYEKYQITIFNQYPHIKELMENQFLVLKDKQLFIPFNKLYISNSIIYKVLN